MSRVRMIDDHVYPYAHEGDLGTVRRWDTDESVIIDWDNGNSGRCHVSRIEPVA